MLTTVKRLHRALGKILDMKVKELCTALKEGKNRSITRTGLRNTKSTGICYILTTEGNLSLFKRGICLISEQAILESACV